MKKLDLGKRKLNLKRKQFWNKITDNNTLLTNKNMFFPHLFTFKHVQDHHRMDRFQLSASVTLRLWKYKHFKMEANFDYIVVGAGINGAWTGYHLAKLNKTVLVIEQVSTLFWFTRHALDACEGSWRVRCGKLETFLSLRQCNRLQQLYTSNTRCVNKPEVADSNHWYFIYKLKCFCMNQILTLNG